MSQSSINININMNVFPETPALHDSVTGDKTSKQCDDDDLAVAVLEVSSPSTSAGTPNKKTFGIRISSSSDVSVRPDVDLENDETTGWDDDENDLNAYLTADKSLKQSFGTLKPTPQKKPSSNFFAAKFDNRRKREWNSKSSPSSIATKFDSHREREWSLKHVSPKPKTRTPRTMARKSNTRKKKRTVPVAYYRSSNSDCSTDFEDNFEELKRMKVDLLGTGTTTVEPDSDCQALEDSPGSSLCHDMIPSPDREATPFLAAVDKCILKLTQELKKAPKETDIRGPAPVKLDVKLHPHQSYALEWLSWRENESPFGGILADEMGLGKTVMMLALICRGKEAASSTKDNAWKSSAERSLITSDATLVVCPASVMGQWEAETKSKAPGLKVLLWHGPHRETSAMILARHDIVVTSYNTLAFEIPKESEKLVCCSPLLKINWKRIVLDEGHIIRNPATAMAQAACRLSASHRWLVTGTPIHNKSLDFYAIVKFLHFDPFDNLQVWKQWIGEKFPSAKQSQRLQAIGKALLLRRTKVEVSAGQKSHQKIPEKTVEDVTVTMKKNEREVYDHIESYLRDQFAEILEDMETRQKELQNQADFFVGGGRRSRPDRTKKSSANMAVLFTIILRCRQAAVLPRLVKTMLDDEEEDFEDYDPDFHLCSLKNPVFDASFVSAKLEKLYEDLAKLRKEASSRGLPMEKAIVVSQWTSLLDIINLHLQEKGFDTVSLTGKTPIPDRMEIMHKFNSQKTKPQILLLSLTAGGCGLNLIGANNLFLMDIHWNPQLELQAQDRIHRFGQTLPVKITRYVSEGTLESRVLELQSRKLELANGLLTGASVTNRSGAGLSIAEMRKLFGL